MSEKECNQNRSNSIQIPVCGFAVSFILGDKAIEAARQSKLPKKVIKIVEEGKRYPEGTAVRMDVTSDKDIAAVVGLAAIKLQH